MAKAEPDAQTVAAGIDSPAAQQAENIPEIQTADCVPGIGEFLIAEGDADHSCDGQHDEQNAQGFFNLLVHSASFDQ